MVLSLGQHPRAHKIRIERRAVNLRQERKNEKPQKIEANGPRYRFVNLKLRPDRAARVTYNAGTYVCNFSMYIFSRAAMKRGFLFAFLHIPKNYNIAEAIKFIETKISEITRGR